jgi:hypothetical protein
MTRGERRRLRPLVVALALLLSFASLGATCVDGVTPNCAGDAGCGAVNLDGAAEADGSTTLPEGSSDGTADGADADASDAADDVEDAGDEI